MSLEIQHLSFKKKDAQILTDISLIVEAGKIIAFLGPNGAGKTTFLKAVMGMIALEGKHDHLFNCIYLKGQCISSFLIHERISAGLIYLPQHCTLFFELTAQENLDIIFDYHQFWRLKNKKLFQEQIDLWAERIGLSGVLDKKSSLLSGGQKRKVEIIRAILMQPSILLLDEPFAGVDPKSIEELHFLFKLLKKQNIGILLSDHHVIQLLSFADYSYLLYQGSIAAKGTSQEILSNDRVQEIYLGKKFIYPQ